jgi:tetratricopeptide (TPR) repeat protein
MKTSNKIKVILFCFYLLALIAKNVVAITVVNDSVRIDFETRILNASDSLLKIAACYEYALLLDEVEDFDESVIQLKKALRIAQNISDHKTITKITNQLGGMYWSAGDCKTSTEYFEQALQNAEIINDENLIAMVKMNLSGNYNSAGDATTAIEYSLAALETKEKNGDIEGICFDYVTVGEIFQNIENIDKWKLYIKKAYDLKDIETCAKMTDVVAIYNNLGTIAEAEKEYDQALAYYDTMMQVSFPYNYNEGMGISILNSALIYQLLDKPEKALELTTESMQYLGDVPYFIMAVNNVKTELLQQLGRTEEALKIAEENFTNENIDYYPGLKQTCLSSLYTLNYELENYKDAFSWNDTLNAYETSLRDDENRKTIEELETKYQTEKKEQQIELLTVENQIRNQALRAGIVIVFILLVLVALILYILQIRKKQAIFVQNDLQQQVLRSQMNPHFIFNVLGSIQNYMMVNDSKKAAGYLSKFASLTRATLEYSSEESISLSDEIAMLKNYMELEQMRKPGIFDFEIECDEELESDFIQVPPMMIQPFIENAIKHGFKKMDSGGVLKITITDKTDWIEFVIEDNGNGIQQASTRYKDHKSMAMEIFQKRRKLIQHKYKKGFSFELQNLHDVDPTQSGVRIRIDLPVMND